MACEHAHSVVPVVGRYYGGAYFVFSRGLNDNLRTLALEVSYASVIGGGPAAVHERGHVHWTEYIRGSPALGGAPLYSLRPGHDGQLQIRSAVSTAVDDVLSLVQRRQRQSRASDERARERQSQLLSFVPAHCRGHHRDV
jgi:hypothetical protein